MTCPQRARLVELGPEGLGDHLDQCPHCRADVDRIDHAMADLWDELDDFLDAEPPLVVAPLPPVAVPAPANMPPPARTVWPAVGLSIAVAAALWLMVWPVLRPSLHELTEPAAAEVDVPDDRPSDAEPEVAPIDEEELPTDVGPQVAPIDAAVEPSGDDGVVAVERAPRGTVVVPAADLIAAELQAEGCSESTPWWTWSTVDARCLAALVASEETALADDAARLVRGDGLTRDDVRRLADEVTRRSGRGEHDAAVGIGRRLVQQRADTRTLRTVTLAAREWMVAASEPSARERRRLEALALADLWVVQAPAGNAAARSVRDSLVRSIDERVLCPPLLVADEASPAPDLRCPYDGMSDAERAAWIVERFAVTPSLGVSQVRTIRQHERMTVSLAAAVVATLPAAHLHRLVDELEAVPGARTDRGWTSVWRPLAVRLQGRVDDLRNEADPTEMRQAYEAVRIWAALAPDDPAAQALAERLRR